MPLTRSSFMTPQRPDTPLELPSAPERAAQPVGSFHGRNVTEAAVYSQDRFKGENTKLKPRALFADLVPSLLR